MEKNGHEKSKKKITQFVERTDFLDWWELSTRSQHDLQMAALLPKSQVQRK